MARVLLENVSKQYNADLAVDDFSIEIADGEFVTLLGPSGCGKTTTLRMIAGFVAPTAGEITIGDTLVASHRRRLSVAPEKRNLGMVFQSYAVWPHMNVFDNVAYPLRIKKQEKRVITQQVEEILEMMGMTGLESRLPHELSGGQQQRIALARAIVMEPEVLLLDEPLSNLDAKLRDEMRIEIKELQRKTGLTVLFVTHDQVEAMMLSDRVVVIDKGRIHQIGSPIDIYSNPVNYFVANFIGNAIFIPAEMAYRSVPSLERSGAKYFTVRPEMVSLTDKDGAFAATVKSRLFLGDSFLYLLDIEGTELRMKTHVYHNFSPGATIGVHFEQVYPLSR